MGDAERELAADRLRDAYVEGRLSHEELTTRLEAVYGASTRGDLVAVGADLPDVAKQRRRIPWTYLEVNGVLWGIWGAQSATAGVVQSPWPLVVTLPWGALVVVDYVRRKARRRARPAASKPQLPR